MNFRGLEAGSALGVSRDLSTHMLLTKVQPGRLVCTHSARPRGPAAALSCTRSELTAVLRTKLPEAGGLPDPGGPEGNDNRLGRALCVVTAQVPAALKGRGREIMQRHVLPFVTMTVTAVLKSALMRCARGGSIWRHQCPCSQVVRGAVGRDRESHVCVPWAHLAVKCRENLQGLE